MSHPKTDWRQRPSGRRFLVLAILLLVPACADTLLYTPLSPSPRPLSPHPADKVEVFEITPPTRPHTNLGLLQIIRGMVSDHSVSEMIASLRRRAAEIGCDAILVTSIDQQGGRDHYPSVQASCILYKETAGSESDDLSAPAAPSREAAQPKLTKAQSTIVATDGWTQTTVEAARTITLFFTFFRIQHNDQIGRMIRRFEEGRPSQDVMPGFRPHVRGAIQRNVGDEA